MGSFVCKRAHHSVQTETVNEAQILLINQMNRGGMSESENNFSTSSLSASSHISEITVTFFPSSSMHRHEPSSSLGVADDEIVSVHVPHPPPHFAVCADFNLISTYALAHL